MISILYRIEQWVDGWLTLNLQSPLSLILVLGAGILNSLTPCTLSMLPITIGYLGGFGQSRPLGQSLLFVAGFATTLTALGLGAAFLGRVYGQTGWGWSVGMGTIALVMGLQLLGLVQLPQWGTIALEKYVPIGLQSYGVGLSFGLASSPCSTPVLATLLAWVAKSQNPFWGGVILLVYALGSCLPLLLSAIFVGSLRSFLAMRQWTGAINYGSALILLLFGTYNLLAAVSHFYR
ncbi:MAG: cytochrome c biogenesis protein CcdA [Cyanobacteria bacterium KgW148]|nr:cytochrome c biogenesis protein CcdA [Cyanobacteria bacterium KgW148]